MQSCGKLDSKIWIVLNCPKRGDKTGPFSSQTGRVFLKHITFLGMSINDIHVEYLYPEIPPEGGFEYWEKHRSTQVMQNFKELKQRIRDCKPNIVFGLGQETLRYFTGHKDISKWRGHLLWNDNLNCKTLFTYDPAHAHRQYFVADKEKPGQYMALMMADMEKAIMQSHTPELKVPTTKYIIKPSFVEAREELKRMLKEGKILSYDIETLEPYEAHFIDCIGFATDVDKAICIPLYIPNGSGLPPERYFKNEVEFLEIMNLIRELMESNIPKVAQNAQFDTAILKQFYNINVKNLVWDTMVAQHCIYSDLPKDLGTLISIYTDLPYHKYLIGTGSLMDRWEYNAADAIANIHIMLGEQEEMRDYGIIEHYENIVNPAISTCIDMQLKGVCVDEKMVNKALQELHSNMSNIEAAINYCFPISLAKGNKRSNFNPTSPTQKKSVFYGYFKCPIHYHKGKPSVDKHAMNKFLEDNRSYVRALAQACIEYKENSVMAGRLKTKTTAGRIHCKYDVTGTDTGRLNSEKSDVFGTGTNLQNLQKGTQRKMLIPNPGCEFCVVDLHSAEAFLVALAAGEMDMVRMLQSGQKVYSWLQEETEKRYPRECDAARYSTAHKEGYKKAKQSVHAMNYGVKPNKMSMESGLPLYVSQWQHTFYHTKFPGVIQRMKDLERQLNATRSVKSMLGRQRVFFRKKDYRLLNQLYAWPSQSTIGEVTIAAMNKLHVITEMHLQGDITLPYVRPALNTHDGIAIECKIGTREESEKAIINAFAIPLKIKGKNIIIPLELAWGSNFNDLTGAHIHYYRD